MDNLNQITLLEKNLNNFVSNYNLYLQNSYKLPSTGVNPSLLTFLISVTGLCLCGLQYNENNSTIYFLFLYILPVFAVIGFVGCCINPYRKIEEKNIELVNSMNVNQTSQELILLYRTKIQILTENNKKALADTLNDLLQKLIIEAREQYNRYELYNTVHQYYLNYQHLNNLDSL